MNTDCSEYSFDEIVEDYTRLGVKIPKNNYLSEGAYPIIDQGQEFIAGYSNDKEGLFTDVPAIVFGDHTRVFKFIDFPFFLGADGVKILKVKKELNYKYLYYYFLQANFPNTGYARHYKWLKDLIIPLPSIKKQNEIVAQLDKCSLLITNNKQLIEKYDLLIKSRFIEMFGDPVRNPKRWEVKKLKETADIITGNTPSRKDKDNYGTFIEWIKTDNITDNTYITTAAEYLSEKGEKLGRTVEAGSILMACIAGSLRSIGRVALTDRKVAFNQQINAIVPKEYNSLFLYALFQNTQSYAQSTVNMALKGILSKGKLEELEYILPPIELQNDFAAFVQQIDKSKFVVQQLLKKIETLYKSLMKEYFEK